MPNRLHRAGGFVVGIVLFLIGFSLLQPSEGMVQTGVTIALAAVMTALGIGVIAAAALPQSLEVGGEDFKPLGMSVKASGGAAVFVLTLGFIYYMKDHQGALMAEPRPVASATEVAEGPAGAAPTTAAEEELAAVEEPASPPAPLLDTSMVQQFQQQQVPPQASYSTEYSYLAATWCSSCCPDGPDYCDQVGVSFGADPQQASVGAIQMCTQNGGYQDTCTANVEYMATGY